MVDTNKERAPIVPGAEREVVKPPRSAEANVAGGNLEVEGWMEKIEKKFARVPNKTNDVSDDSVVVQPFGDAQGKQPPVTLPVTQQQMATGKKASTDQGIAWLVAWAIRQIKRFVSLGRGVRLQDLPEVKE